MNCHLSVGCVGLNLGSDSTSISFNPTVLNKNQSPQIMSLLNFSRGFLAMHDVQHVSDEEVISDVTIDVYKHGLTFKNIHLCSETCIEVYWDMK